jgi:hypothetical protein
MALIPMSEADVDVPPSPDVNLGRGKLAVIGAALGGAVDEPAEGRERFSWTFHLVVESLTQPYSPDLVEEAIS